MVLVKDVLSDKLHSLFIQWQEEYINNIQHDMNETKAWNALIEYLMELEKGTLPLKK